MPRAPVSTIGAGCGRSPHQGAADEPGSPAAVRETHTGLVFLVGDRAYKMKKPVDLGFLDFRTERTRAEVCRREVDLNRRLAPDVYLGVADVTGEDGRICDHLVVMRRMPESRRLSTLVRSGHPVDDELRRLAHVVASFHSRCDRSPTISAEGSRDALRDRWTTSFEQMRPFHGTVLDADVARDIEQLTLRFLQGREPLFAGRMHKGSIVDGHGDLLADDIFCLPDGPRILDCLEFDDRLRHLDQLDDAACLAMDLEYCRGADLAERFLGWYGEFSGDPAPPSLVHHYVAYRAVVRAKVACLRSAQGDPEAVPAAGRLASLARRHLASGAVGMTLVGGLPGTGKSTLAGALADSLGCTVVSSDRVRKELAGVDPTRSAAADYLQGIYTPEWTERTYAEVLARAERLLALGESVVLDSSWTDQAKRRAAADVAAATSSDLVQILCEAPLDVTTGRLSQRHGISDADPGIAAEMRATIDPWPEAVVIDTTPPPADVAASALATIRPSDAMLPWALRT